MITEVTRRAIFEELASNFDWWGRLPETEFLGRLYSLADLPSSDSRFPNALSDIQQHRYSNEDWPDDWIFADSRFELHQGNDSFVRFLSETVHPVVRPDLAEAVRMVAMYNRLLAPDGYELVEVDQISGRPVYGAQQRPPGPLVVVTKKAIDPAETYDDIWLHGHVRVFLSHLSGQHHFVSEVNQELRRIGIDGFVAHSSIEPDREWQREIERALRSCDVLVGLLHRGFSVSHWTQQEVGWALGREIPTLMIRFEEDPVGFEARHQARTPSDISAWGTAGAIAVWLSNHPIVGSQVVESLMKSLAHAGSYVAGRDAALRLEQIGRLSEPVLNAICTAYLGNDELYPKHVGGLVVERILKNHQRNLPTR